MQEKEEMHVTRIFSLSDNVSYQSNTNPLIVVAFNFGTCSQTTHKNFLRVVLDHFLNTTSYLANQKG